MDNQCTAKAKSTGEQCKNGAVNGTDKCRFHGGETPVKHGLYSKYSSNRLSERIEEIRESEDQLTDLREEISVARALLSEQLQGRDSVDAEAAESLMNLLDKTSRIIQRYHKIEFGEKHVIKGEEVNQFIQVVKVTIRSSFDNCDSPQELMDRIGERLVNETDHNSEDGEVI